MKFDGTINIPTVVTVMALATTGIGAFYNVKEIQSNNQQAILSLKEADMRHEAALRELKADSGGPLAEIKQDIKELRADIKEVRAEIRAEFKKR
jgi:predicted  nucleic acid-binding Zn-ribbon protein